MLNCLRNWRVDSLGYRADHVADCGLASASDDTIWTYAASHSAVIITKDADFAIRCLLNPGPPVVWLRLGNSRRAALLLRVELEWPAIVMALEQGETLVEVV